MFSFWPAWFVVADYVKLDGTSFSDLQSQQLGLKRWDREVKPEERNQKEEPEERPQTFLGRRVHVG